MKMDCKSFTLLIETLVQQGDIASAQSAQSGHGGRPTLVYRLAGQGG
jgi:predicted ArsR family transcriptional regulator